MNTPNPRVCAVLWAFTAASPSGAAAQNPLLELERADATKLLVVDDAAGMVVRGESEVGLIPASGGGVRMMWYPAKAAFRAGEVLGDQWDDANIGEVSFASGFRTIASGRSSTALGSDSRASGSGSTALGVSTTASGGASVAMGSATTASGDFSTAMGFRTTASGRHSVAMGQAASTAGHAGSFVYGDFSDENSSVTATAPNQFVVRAAGGFRFRTAPSLVTGCDLPPLSGTFQCTSSRSAKTDFQPVDADTVLARLSSLPVQRWRYHGTVETHVGPAAEDFYAAFGLGTGETTIATVDADGITMLAVQALERRTAQLQTENTELRAELARLRAEVSAIAAGSQKEDR